MLKITYTAKLKKITKQINYQLVSEIARLLFYNEMV